MKLFFWQKKKDIPLKEKIETIIPELIKAAPEIRDLLRYQPSSEDGPQPPQISDGFIIGRLYDFFNNLHGSNGVFEDGTMPNPAGPPEMVTGGFIGDFTPVGIINNISVDSSGNTLPQRTISKKEGKAQRMEANPKDVMDELETTPRIKEFNLDELQEKINTLKDKNLFTNQRFVKEQIKGLIDRLENRKKYLEFRDFYIQFPNTTDSRIDALLSKYKLVMKTADLFIPTFPKDAIDVMKEYTAQTQKLCGKDPVFYVIAEEKDFKKKIEKLDPILLAQSPFGFFWQILGAWDKEMLLLSEL